MAGTENIVVLLTSVARYGGQLTAVLHNYALTCDHLAVDFEGSISIFDATVVTLKQVLELVKDHVEHGKDLFSQQGLEYAHLLAVECGNTFVRIETATKEGGLSRGERRALKKETSSPPTVLPASILANLTLDEKSFLKSVEKGIRAWKNMDVWDFIKRLHDLQLHLLLVYQVVTVGALSKDVSSGKVDIQSIVSYHNRIKRAANLAGIKTPKDRSRRSCISDTESSGSSDSDSDGSTASSVISRASRGRRPPPLRLQPPLPLTRPRNFFPPPPPPPQNWGCPRSPPRACVPPCPAPPPSSNMPAQIRPSPSVSPDFQSQAPVRGPVAGPMGISTPEATQQGNPPAYVDRPIMIIGEKDSTRSAEEDSEVEIKDTVKPPSHEARLFKTQPQGFTFKLKSIFRSRESLAKEMKRTLKDNESQLVAFVFDEDGFKMIPHSVFHSLEATHMKTILSQLHDNTWYNTFTTLNPDEHKILSQIMSPGVGGQGSSIPDRELVVLKLLREEKYTRDSNILSWVPRTRLYPNGAVDRTLLVILREKLIDGKPLMHTPPLLSTRPPPPPPLPPAKFKEQEARHSLASFAEYTIRFRDHHANGSRPLSPIVERIHNDQPQIKQRVQSFQLNGGNVTEITLLLTERQSEQASILMKEIRCDETDPRFQWGWVEISLHNSQGEITDFHPRRASTSNIAETANVMHLIAKRSLNAFQDAVEIRNRVRIGPPMGFNPGPPPATLNLPFQPPPFPPGPPVPRGPVINSVPPPPRPPITITVPLAGTGRGRGRPVNYCRSDASSYYESSDSSSSTRPDVRGQLRQAKKRQLARRSRAKRVINDSDSDVSDPEEDNILIDLQMKKGDDVVTKLLEIWTPRATTKGMESA